MKKHNLFKGLFTALLALVLVAGTFAASAKAGGEDDQSETGGSQTPTALTFTYDPAGDTITSDVAGVVYVLKAEKSNKIDENTSAYTVGTTPIPLSDLGIKSTTKDVYLYGMTAAVTKATTVNANTVIDAQIAKKVVITVDYTKADTADSTDVLKGVYVDKNKKENALASTAILWSAEKDGTYVAINDSTGFKGAKLAELLTDGATIYVKMAGSAATRGFDAKNAVRTSAPYAVKIAKQAKAPKITLDVKKDTLTIKNGYDIAAGTEGATLTWKTILPYLKDSKNDVYYKDTSKYLPTDKKATNAKDAKATVGKTDYFMFTKTQIKKLTLDQLVAVLGSGDLDAAAIDVAVRISATTKKPASAVTYIKIPQRAAEPQIKEYNTEGFESFKVEVPAIDNADSDSDTAPKYEMAVIKATDLSTVDFSNVAWKAVKAGTKLTNKVKTKYVDVNGKTVTAVLKEGTAVNNAETVIVIRRAGVKAKTVDESVLASQNLIVSIYKDATSKMYILAADTGERSE